MIWFKSSSSHQYALFFKRLVIFAALIFILDYGIGTVMRYLYFTQKSGPQYQLTYSIEETKADVLFFGSSRANHHYVPSVFEQQLYLSSYNLGRDGHSVLYYDAVLEAILFRYRPKLIILDINPGELEYAQYSYDRLAALLPFYHRHPEMQEAIERKGALERLKLFSRIYPFNSAVIPVFASKWNGERASLDSSGYIPLYKIWSDSAKWINSVNSYPLDSVKVDVYHQFIRKCKNAKVDLYVISSPYLFKSKGVDASIATCRKIADSYGVPFWDYSQDAYFLRNPRYFADVTHLNDDGARLFSAFIARRIKQYADSGVIRL